MRRAWSARPLPRACPAQFRRSATADALHAAFDGRPNGALLSQRALLAQSMSLRLLEFTRCDGRCISTAVRCLHSRQSAPARCRHTCRRLQRHVPLIVPGRELAQLQRRERDAMTLRPPACVTAIVRRRLPMWNIGPLLRYTTVASSDFEQPQGLIDCARSARLGEQRAVRAAVERRGVEHQQWRFGGTGLGTLGGEVWRSTRASYDSASVPSCWIHSASPPLPSARMARTGCHRFSDFLPQDDAWRASAGTKASSAGLSAVDRTRHRPIRLPANSVSSNPVAILIPTTARRIARPTRHGEAPRRVQFLHDRFLPCM